MENSNSYGGPGIASILTIIFVLAKIFGYVHFSWLVCFMPLIVALGILLVVVVGALLIAGYAVYQAGK